MISFIKGSIADITENTAIIENNGMGYEVFMSSRCLSQIHIGDKIMLYTYLHVREDAMQLFGFTAKDDLNIFKLLLNVNGIGPKGAIGVLSGITADDLRFAVLSDDIKTISKAPGIGKKTAQKLILELKDKLSIEEFFELKFDHKLQNEQNVSSTFSDASAEAVEALVALGYSSTEALRAVKKVTDVPMDNVEAILRAALKNF